MAILAFLTTLRLFWLFYHLPADQPVAEEGILDLQDYDFGVNQTIALDGEWAFFPERLIADPQDIHSNQVDMFTDISANIDKPIKFGTYYLKIYIDKEMDFDHLFSMSIPSAHTASALYINGHLKEHSGTISANKN